MKVDGPLIFSIYKVDRFPELDEIGKVLESDSISSYFDHHSASKNLMMGLGQIAEFVYTVILKPRPLRVAVNTLLKMILPRQVKLHSAHLSLNSKDPVVSGALAMGVYEGREIDFFLRHLKGNMTLVDVGANIGLYSCLALASKHHTGKIVAFEPHRESLEYLKTNLTRNAKDQEVILIEAAAANVNGTVELYANPENKGDNRLYAADELEPAGSVDARSIDSVCEENNIQAINFLKVDVQGAESGVIAGACKVLNHSTDCIVMTEFWPQGITSEGSSPAEYIAKLNEIGFTLFEFDEVGSLKPFDAEASLRTLNGRKYANLIGFKGEYHFID